MSVTDMKQEKPGISRWRFRFKKKKELKVLASFHLDSFGREGGGRGDSGWISKSKSTKRIKLANTVDMESLVFERKSQKISLS